MKQRLSFSKYFLLLLFIFAGCNAPKDQLMVFNEHFKNSNYQQSLEYAQTKISKGKNPAREDLLWALQAGAVDRIMQNYPESTEYFDKSEEFLNYYDFQNETAGAVAATIVNENVNPYAGEEYDGIMVNTYKALNFMIQGNDELTRVEFNRALDRQRRAKETYAKEIAKIKDEIEKQEQQSQAPVKQSVENPQVQSIISQQYPSLYNFRAYPDFVNPFTTYIAGIYFNLVGDHTKAIDLLKESYGMVPDNDYIAEDFAVTEKILDGQEQLNNTVWVIFENGMGPVKEEFRVDLPLFIATSAVKYAGMALPKLVFREQAYPYLSIKTANNTYPTQQIADMDRVIQTEFRKDFQAILTRAIISTTVKVAAQYALDQQGSAAASVASIFVAAYSYATTAADVRIWTTLPKDFQVARLSIPEDRTITIDPPGGAPIVVQIPPCKNALVYVKIPFKEAAVIYDVITY